MDPFEEPYWSQLQAVLWVCTRLKEPVQLAVDQRGLPRDLNDGQEDPPGYDSDADLIADVVMPGGRMWRHWRVGIRPDCSFEEAEEKVVDAMGRGRLRALGRRNGEGDREQIPQDQWADLQFYWAPPPRELLPRLPRFVNRCSRYAGPRDQLRQDVTYWTDVLLERAEVLALWSDPVSHSLGAETERLTLAEAVALLVHGCPASKHEWQSLRGQHTGRFPEAIRQRIEEAGRAILEMIWRRDIEAWGRPCNRDDGTGRMMPTGGMALVTNDRSFLAEQPWVDPCADAIWTELNDQDRGYRDVVLDRPQFLAAVEVRRALASHECPVSPDPVDAVTNESRTRSAPTLGTPAPASIQTKHSRSSGAIKGKGGRRAPWTKDLKKYLRFRLEKGDDICSMTLKELRLDFSNHASIRQIRTVPTSRSALEDQLKRVRQEVIAEHHESEQRDRDPGPPLSEITRAPGIGRK